jgi:hypothetical protein
MARLGGGCTVGSMTSSWTIPDLRSLYLKAREARGEGAPTWISLVRVPALEEAEEQPDNSMLHTETPTT